MTAISKNLYINKPDEIIGKYNNTYHRTIRMKPVQPGIYVDYGVEHNDRDPKFKVGYHLRIPKCKNIFAFYKKELQKASQKNPILKK